VSDQFFWFATRGAGIMAWFSALVSVLVGLMLSSLVLGRRPTIPWLTDLHRYLGAMSVVFLAIHMGTLWADSFVTFSWAELLIPGKAEVPGYTRTSFALGVISAWILVVVELSSLIKQWLPARVWHTVHLTSFGVVVMGAVHGIEAGSDSGNRILVASATSVLTAIALVSLIRLSRHLSERKHRYEMVDEPRPARRQAARQRQPRQGRQQRPPDRDQGPVAARQGPPPSRQGPPPSRRPPAAVAAETVSHRPPPPSRPAPRPRPRPRPAPRPRPRRAPPPLRWEDRQ
jgi:hypothetical protein